MIAVILVFCGIAYHLLAIIAVARFRQRAAVSSYQPPVSILKPVRGLDPHFYEAIRSHAAQQYPEFELIFGTADPNDPARADIEKLHAEFPAIPIRMIDTANDAPNGKVGSLEILAKHAQHEVLLVNDGDILVPPDYLRRVIGQMEDTHAGLVTCLYTGRGWSIATQAEAIGIATEFAPSVLVARMLGDSGFALGATMAFRAGDLKGIGGFAAIREFLADDYQLGARIAATGKRVVLSDCVVQTGLGAGTWRDVWKHQVRWSRTLRVSRFGGYFGYILTQLAFWCAVAALAGHWRVAILGLVVRLISATSAMKVLRAGRGGFLAPLRDLFGVAVWAAGMVGNEVEWRGIRFRLMKDGRIRPI